MGNDEDQVKLICPNSEGVVCKEPKNWDDGVVPRPLILYMIVFLYCIVEKRMPAGLESKHFGFDNCSLIYNSEIVFWFITFLLDMLFIGRSLVPTSGLQAQEHT